jgi:hypothetical protein
MSKKKQPKIKKAPSPPSAEPAPAVDNSAAPVSESIESDAPGVARRSIEADFEATSSDVERPAE